ncbi:MAG: hypothetical protein DMF84_11265 [Acidobacteria bacterium]|nr:MAG: hypothetical protein DMF84_11265 [Acidobacteriota bacterium]
MHYPAIAFAIPLAQSKLKPVKRQQSGHVTVAPFAPSAIAVDLQSEAFAARRRDENRAELRYTACLRADIAFSIFAVLGSRPDSGVHRRSILRLDGVLSRTALRHRPRSDR